MMVIKLLTAATVVMLAGAAQAKTPPKGFYYVSGVNKVEKLPSAVAPVPEPATWAMMVGGFGLIGVVRRRNRDRSVVA